MIPSADVPDIAEIPARNAPISARDAPVAGPARSAGAAPVEPKPVKTATNAPAPTSAAPVVKRGESAAAAHAAKVVQQAALAAAIQEAARSAETGGPPKSRKADEVTIHGPDGFLGEPSAPAGKSGPAGAKKPRPQVVGRENVEFHWKSAALLGAFVLAVLALDWWLGQVMAGHPLLSWIVLTLILALSIPISAAGYWILWDHELEAHQGSSLWIRALICGCLYSLCWIIRDALPVEYTESIMSLAPIAIVFLAAGAAVPLATLDLEYTEGFFHFCFFVVLSMLLRWTAGLSWY